MKKKYGVLMALVLIGLMAGMVVATDSELSSSSSSSSVASTSSSVSSSSSSSKVTSSGVSSAVSSSKASSSSSSSSMPESGAIRQAQEKADIVFPAFIVGTIAFIIVAGLGIMTSSVDIIATVVGGTTLLLGIIVAGYLISVL